MDFTNQDRECFVTLSRAKGLSRWAMGCFAALILRFAQDDGTDFGRETSSSAVGVINQAPTSNS
jgi:hypothetical protein